MTAWTGAVAGPWVPARGGYYLQGSFAYQAAGRVYDDRGMRIPLSLDAEYTERRLDFYGEWGLGAGWALVLSLPVKWARTEAVGLVPSRSAGPGDGLVGLRMALLQRPVVGAIEAAVRFPLGYDSGASPALGDHQNDYEMRLAAGRSWNGRLPGYVQGEGGYRVRSAAPADEWIYALEAGGWGTRSLLLSADLRGVVSTGSVSFVSLNLLPDASAVSESHTTASVTATYRPSGPVDIRVGYSAVLRGRNTLYLTGWRLAVALRRP